MVAEVGSPLPLPEKLLFASVVIIQNNFLLLKRIIFVRGYQYLKVILFSVRELTC